MRNIAILILTITALAGAVSAQSGVTGRRWTLTQVSGAAVGDVNAYIEIGASGRRFTGNTGCNLMNGSVRLRGSTIRFGAVVTTRRACFRKPAEVEGALLTALRDTNRFSVNRGRLRLFAGRRLLAEFSSGNRRDDTNDEPPVTGTLDLGDRKWVLSEIARAPIPKVQEEAFIVFDPVKGSAGGNTSCNVFGGSYKTNGGRLSITDTISTMRACIEDERMDIERKFLDALKQADRYQISGDRLMLYRRSDLLLTFEGRKK